MCVCVGGGGSADKIFATMLLHFVIPFNLVCNMTIFWKSWILTYGPIPMVLGEGVCGQNIFYNVAVFVILFNLICTVTIFWKKLNLNLLTPSLASGMTAGKIFATMLLHLWLSLIWYITWPCSEKVDLWPSDSNPQGRGWGSWVGVCGAKYLLPCCCWKSWILTYWPHPQGPYVSVLLCRRHNKIQVTDVTNT